MPLEEKLDPETLATEAAAIKVVGSPRTVGGIDGKIIMEIARSTGCESGQCRNIGDVQEGASGV